MAVVFSNGFIIGQMGWREKLTSGRGSQSPDIDRLNQFERLSGQLERLVSGSQTDDTRSEALQLVSQIISTGDRIAGKWRVAAIRSEVIMLDRRQRLASEGKQPDVKAVREIFESTVREQARILQVDELGVLLAIRYANARLIKRDLVEPE